MSEGQTQAGKGVQLRCGRCGHKWNYRGKSRFYATCPSCYRKVNIKKSLIKGGEKRW